jgi:hypothetical protein
MVVRLQINLTELFSPHEMIQEVFDSRNWVLVSDHDFIQSPVINAESLGPVILLHQNDWAPIRR